MVRLMIGRAGSGKTSAIIREIHNKGLAGETGMILIVPEQFSHDAERELSRICGSSAGLYGEVLSFSRMSSRVLSETGGFGIKPMDQGGRVLLMSAAMNSVAGSLKTYNSVISRADFVKGLVSTWDEFTASGLTTKDIQEASDTVQELGLANKLKDMSLIFSAYQALMPKNMCDPYERLEMMAEKLENSTLFSNTVYFDGFSDFTYQQLAVIKKLMKMDADMVFCLTCDTIYSTEEVFRLARDTVSKLVRFAKEAGCKVEITVMEAEKQASPELCYLEKNLLKSNVEHYDGACTSIELYKAESISQECELAASKTIELVRDNGLHWRDVGVAVCDFQSCASILESIFSKYGIPVMNTGKSDILAKPVMMLITSALDVVSRGWEYESVFKYLKTELTDITRDERDILENYVLRWNIRGSGMWLKNEPWSYNPSGYKKEFTENEQNQLDIINSARAKISEPFIAFEKALREADTATGKAKALYGFLSDSKVSLKLEEKVRKLRGVGEVQLAGEYIQLWDIIVTALEQFSDVLGAMKISTEEFRRLFTLLLSQYQVGTIPMSLDRVSLGDMSKMRRRGIKCLLILGATDEAMPKMSGQNGLLSDYERDEIKSCGMELNDNSEIRLFREFNQIYTSLTLPSMKLILSYCESSRPSFVVTEIEETFGIKAQKVTDEIKINAPQSCFELAMGGNKQAQEYFNGAPEWSGKLKAVKNAVTLPRGKLSAESAKKLYSDRIDLSASRVDKFNSCKFMYYMEYGLKAKSRQESKLDAPLIGSFMHYILENVARDAEKFGGFGKLTYEQCDNLTAKYVNSYAEEMLGGLQDKTARFVYLFNRLTVTVGRIVRDMAGELAVSDFKPLDFELSFARGGDIDTVQVGDGQMTAGIRGKVDRVDGWVHDDKLYLRVVDYKTGKKSFNLSDIWYGMGMQMLIYLFALERNGAKRYGREIVPAGVLYAPAVDDTVSAPLGIDSETLEKERDKKLVRKGLILDDPEVLTAMEHEDNSKYLPVKFNKTGDAVGDSLCSAAQLGRLAKHVDNILLKMSHEIKNGRIDADPYYRGQWDNACVYCQYREACHFMDNSGDRKRYLKKLRPNEVWQRLAEDSQPKGN